MSVATEAASGAPADAGRQQGRRAPRDRRRLRRACAARRLHRSDLRHAAALAGRVRHRLSPRSACCAPAIPARWRAFKFRPRCSRSGSACRWCWRSAPRCRASAIWSRARSVGFWTLVLALLIGGLGSSTQHPLASALVARAFAGSRSMKALGTYNFAGDIGKMSVPAAASLMLVLLPWQPVLAIMGLVGLAAAVAIFWLAPRLAGRSPCRAESVEEARRRGRRRAAASVSRCCCRSA